MAVVAIALTIFMTKHVANVILRSNLVFTKRFSHAIANEALDSRRESTVTYT